MNSNSGNNDDKGFLLQLSMRAEQKVQEYSRFLQERQRLERKIELSKRYIEQLNEFLRSEGQEPIPLKAIASSRSGFGKPGNRSKELPIRHMKWEGMTINQIIESILNTSPNMPFHPRKVVPLIYEIRSDADLNMVMRNVRSTMQRGVREELWERPSRGKFKAKVTEQQGALVNT